MTRSVLLLLLSILLSGELLAETYFYRLSFRDDPATTMVIGWSGDEGTVHYGTADLGTDFAAYPMSQAVDRRVRHRGEDQNFVRLSGLTPNTVYYFVIRDNTGALSQRFSFLTLPDDSGTPLSFINGGDTRLGFNDLFEPCDCKEARLAGNRMVAKLRPDFVVFNGDFVLNNFLLANQTNAEWRDWFTDWQLTIGPDGRMSPLVISTGNHEDDVDYPFVSDPNFKDVYNLFDAPNEKVFYALNFGGDLLRMYSLNTEMHACWDTDQLEWLENDLRNYSAPSNRPFWKTVSYHYPIVPHSNYNVRNDLRSCWAPLFDEFNVQLAMESHTHSMKTTYPISRSDEEGNDGGFVLDETCGTVYIGEGNWSAPQRSLYPPRDWTRQTAAIRSFFYITVNRDSMVVNSVLFENIDAVTQATDNTPGSPLPAGVSTYEETVNPADAGPLVIRNNRGQGCDPEIPTAVLDEAQKRARIYPNPVCEDLFIELSRPLSGVVIEVYDARGKQCQGVRIAQNGPRGYHIDARTLCADVGVILIKAEGDVESHKYIRVRQ